MERIIINESDQTTDITVNESTDIVYIPGFSTNTALSALTPTLCRNLFEFNQKIGSTAPVFTSAQVYPVASSSVSGFPERAIPTSGGSTSSTQMFAANQVDPSYVIAKELVSAGIPVLYEKCNGYTYTDSEQVEHTTGVTVADMYYVLANKILTTAVEGGTYVSNLLAYDYDYKYLTTGGYPIYEYGQSSIPGSQSQPYQQLSSPAVQIAKIRGDVYVLLDHTDNNERPLVGTNSVFNIVNTSLLPSANNEDTFAALYTPWGNYTLSCDYTNTTAGAITASGTLPGSFAYLLCLAKSIKTNPNFLAISGIARGAVPSLNSLHTDKLLTNAIADVYQPDVSDTSITETVCINAITKINGKYCIWGNRTLQSQSNSASRGYATRFVNLRNLMCDIKKTVRKAAIDLMFEPNTDILWANFKAKITPLLESMKSGSGISGYKIIKSTTSSKVKLAATIKIYPIYSVEAFEINIKLTDEEVSVE